MSQELFYTSAPRGLKPGSRGFCTVAATRGLSGGLTDKLESLSGYRPLFPPSDPKAPLNPVAFSHLRLSAAGKTYSVLSRVSAAGLDYSERTNKLAHHVLLDAGETTPGGPAWLLRQPGFMATGWDGEVRQLADGRRVPAGDSPPAKCQAWENATGDAGWAGVLAESFLADPSRTAYLIYDLGMDLLPLIDESLRLLPPERRWDVTFSTYFTGLPPGFSCHWRCVPVGSPEAAAAKGQANVLIIDLTKDLPAPPPGDLVDAARSGKKPLNPSSGVLQRRPPPKFEPKHSPREEEEDFAGFEVLTKSAPPPPPRSTIDPSLKGNLLYLGLGLLLGIVISLAGTYGLWGKTDNQATQRIQNELDRKDRDINVLEDTNQTLGELNTDLNETVSELQKKSKRLVKIEETLNTRAAQIKILETANQSLKKNSADLEHLKSKLEKQNDLLVGNVEKLEKQLNKEVKDVVRNYWNLTSPSEKNSLVDPKGEIDPKGDLKGQFLDVNKNYTLNIIGTEASRRFDWILDTKVENKVSVSLKKNGKQIEVLEIVKEAKKLMVEWQVLDDTKNVKNDILSELRNSVLEIRDGDKRTYIALREPRLIRSLTYNFDSTGAQSKLVPTEPSDTVDPQKPLFLVLGDIKGKKGFLQVQYESVEQRQRPAFFFGEDDTPRALGFPPFYFCRRVGNLAVVEMKFEKNGR